MINHADVPPKLPNSLSSLRRTLSADLSPAHINSSSSSFMKRAQSSDHLQHVFGEAQDHQDQKEVDDHRLNIQGKKGAFEDIWSSILSTKNNESGSGSNPPYVHPLVRRSASSLSAKSLQFCTESLGSETGSDGFGSEELHPDPVEPEPQVQVQIQDPRFAGNYNYNECETESNKEYSYMRRAPPSPIPTKKSMVRSASFPPPLPSLSQSHHMRSHRRDGRLVVEAVSTPSTPCLRAHRRDGRLLLTLSSDPDDRYNYHYNSNHVDDDVADDDCYTVHQGPLQNHHFDEHDDDDDDDEDEDVEEKVKELAIEFVMEEERASCKMIMTSKLIGSKKWEARNFNATVINEVEAEDEAAPPLLPPLNTSTTTALNDYEYYWRQSSRAAVVVKDENGNYNKWVLGRSGNKITAQAQIQTQAQAQAQRNVVMKEVVVGKEYENLLPFLRGCKAKEPRRSLLFLEPYCIATS